MRAILINSAEQKIQEVEYNNDFKTIKDHIGHGCELFEVPMYLENRDSLYCDESGLYGTNRFGIQIRHNGTLRNLIGNMLVLNYDEEGDSQSAVSTIAELESIITWVKFA